MSLLPCSAAAANEGMQGAEFWMLDTDAKVSNFKDDIHALYNLHSPVLSRCGWPKHFLRD
jgi:hypothetical protein